MITSSEKNLKIVNASAGSGKTYHLVKEFILLLIDQDKGKSFSSIIAMTFTNKAALEMKERIISGLDKVGSPKYFKNKEIELTKQLANESKLSIEEVQKRCRFVLQNILHQYEDFNVMTIDKFNLRLIRSFGRDLDLSHDFDVVMDEVDVIEKIVDDLLNKLGQEQSKTLNELLFKYAEVNLEEGNSWNFRKKLIDFGRILTSERNRKKVNQLLEMDFSIEQFKILSLRKKQLDKEFIELTNSILNLFDSGAVNQSEVAGKSRTPGRVKTISKDGVFFTKVTAEKPLLTKAIYEGLDDASFPEVLSQAFLKLQNFWDSSVQEYAGTTLFLKNFFNMALLQYMANALETIKKEEQLILISEFSALISKLIQEEHTPFIYERLGTRYKHFLLDEFQDTSHMQWLNLIPLIHESLSTNNENLIVGDPKQSIYRFKNGLAEQFISLPKIYNPDNDSELNRKSNYFSETGELSQLDSNYRSSPTIVNFNNSFFEAMKLKMTDVSANYYNSIVQLPMSEKNGLIHILSEEKETNTSEIVSQLEEWIEQCKEDGFDYGDICILGNKNKECNDWAIGLTDKGYKVVSADSLLIDSNIQVQLTIAFLKWRLKSGESEKKQFAELFFRWKNDNYDVFQTFIKKGESEIGKKYRYFDETLFLETYFKSYSAFFFKYESIYDLIQGFYRLLDFNELENSYLHHLADITYEYELKKGPNLRGFIEDYQRRKNKIAVQIPESDKAIKIMTIHKSKGLEFPVVILPSFNSKMDVKSSFLVTVDDFVVYKKPSKNDSLNTLVELYNEESSQVVTDFINLCYVAMTRPIERLYIQNYFEKNSFGALFHSVLEEQKGAQLMDDKLEFILTDGDRTLKGNEKESTILFEPEDVKDKLWFPDISLQDNEELYTDDYLSAEMQFGIQFHLLASRTEDLNDIDENISEAIASGEVDSSNSTELKLKLKELLSMTDYTKLFQNKTSVLNEQAFLVDVNTLARPDKVILKENETIIIDYKTGLPTQKDVKQINGYKQLLNQMSYPNVKCYLYYSALGELKNVG